MADPVALVGSESLMGREIRELAASGLPTELKLIAAEHEESGKLTEQAGEPVIIWGLDAQTLREAAAVVLAGSPESTRAALKLDAGRPLIDLTHAAEEHPHARLRAPLLEPDGFQPPAGAVHVIAHPAAIALALFLERLHARHRSRRSLVHIFEPASERGSGGLDELQQQTVSLLSFKSMPKKVFDAQLSFNMLSRYGDEAPFALQEAELRIERHLATLLAMRSDAPPLPSLRLVQAPVFHGYSFSVWVELEENPGVADLEQWLASGQIDVRGGDLEPPTAVGIAGQSGIAVGGIAPDRNSPRAFWFWMVADNLRLAAENALAVARGLL